MNQFFKKIFGNSNKDKRQIEPDNTKLFKLIMNFIQNKSLENYAKVVDELKNGNAFLILPAYNESIIGTSGWTPAPEGYSIKWEGYFVDGLAATTAFTSKDALYTWTQKGTQYVALSSRTFIELCKKNGIRRIVIDNNLPTVVVLQDGE